MIIYFDMDGVLADWVDGFERKFPDLAYEDFNAMSTEERDRYRMIIDSDVNFYANLRPFDHVINVFNALVQCGFDVQILTSVGEEFPDIIMQQKTNWISSYLGDDVVINFVQKSSQKAQFANSEAILIDDREKSVVPFVQAGGRAILFDARENDRDIFIEIVNAFWDM